jgi:hypothetical protein
VSRLLLLVGGLVSGTLLGLFGAVLTILVFGPGGYGMMILIAGVDLPLSISSRWS